MSINGIASAPGFFDFFKSYFYNNNETYLPPVDLSESALAPYLLPSDDSNVKIVQHLLRHKDIQEIFSEPLSYNFSAVVPETNRVLESQGFTLLSTKGGHPYYSVVKHPDLAGWVIKSTASRTEKAPCGTGPIGEMNEVSLFTEEEGLLRLAMKERIAQIAKEKGITVTLPEKKLVPIPGSEEETDLKRKYVLLSQELDVLSEADTIKTLKEMPEHKQSQIARNISQLVQAAGIVDASFGNIRLLKDSHQIAIIDTEPAGLLTAKQSQTKKSASVEKCARIGLTVLLSQVSTQRRIALYGNQLMSHPQEGLKPFYAQVEADLDNAQRFEISRIKVALSVLSLGLYPLIIAIVALVKTYQTSNLFNDILYEGNRVKTPCFWAQIDGVPYRSSTGALLNAF